MPFGHDDAVVQFQASRGTDKSASRSAFCVAGLADHARDAHFPGICHGDLDLSLLSEGAKDGYIFKAAFGSLDGQPLFADILARLA